MAASSGNCNRCGEQIQTSQFLRVGEYKFHKQHFTCVNCDKHLQGQKFHVKERKFYCADCYVVQFAQTCRHCEKKILSGSVIQAFGGHYHSSCFVCRDCGKPFEAGKYYEHEGQPYCEQHYVDLTSEKCEFCKKAVDDTNLVRVQGRAFHSSCLFCSHCQTPLAKQGSIFQREGQAFCRGCYLTFFCKRCTACGDHILQSCVTVNNELYHPACLKCSVCAKKLEKYICISGYLRCEEHVDFSTDPFPCHVCGKDIDPNPGPTLFAGKKVHDACFNCDICKSKLDKTTAWLKKDWLCCQNCLMLKDDRMPPPRPHSATSTPSSASSLRAPLPTKSRRKSEAAAMTYLAGAATEERKTPRKIEWRKGELIGKGSFGKVYMGMNAATGELIAVKQVRIKTTEEQDQAKEIENEIKLMQDLRHPNIVTLLGTERTKDKLSILMEYVPGKSLDTLLEKFGAFSEKVIKSYTKQLLEALAYCHSNKVIHRDIKGKNILIDTKGNLKLADFGSAKRVQNLIGPAAPSVSYNYTPLWTAPEVLTGNYNSRVDIWSLGCVIIEMASGKPPWSEHNFENPFRALYHIGNSGSLPKVPDSLSPQAREFLLLCLQRNPEKRPSAAELLTHSWLKDADEGAGTGNDSDSDSDDESGAPSS